MHRTLFTALFAASALAATAGLAQTGPTRGDSGAANLCQELLAYAEEKAAEPPGDSGGQAASPAAAPLSRSDSPQSGTQGGGSVGPSSSSDTSSQTAAPPTTPVEPGANSAPAVSPHATDPSQAGQGASAPGAAGPDEAFKLAGGITVQQVRELVEADNRQNCREAAQTMRRAGADLPAGLIALSAYEPDAANRQ